MPIAPSPGGVAIAAIVSSIARSLVPTVFQKEPSGIPYRPEGSNFIMSARFKAYDVLLTPFSLRLFRYDDHPAKGFLPLAERLDVSIVGQGHVDDSSLQ